MSAHNFIYYLSLTLIFLGSCRLKPVSEETEKALASAENNKTELFKVIQYYQGAQDSLKLKAALFLIENMVNKSYLSGRAIDEYYIYIDSVYQIKQDEYDISYICEKFRKQTKFRKEMPVVEKDLQTLTAEYLIRNIEGAFDVWNKPWNKHLDFEDFCEYLLPYRVGTEMPEEWRSLYFEHFNRLLQSDTIQTAKDACVIINNELIKYPMRIVTSSMLPINLRPSTLFNIKFGECGDYTSLAVYAMRSVGIPVAREIIPHWGRKIGRHVFNVVYNNDWVSYSFGGAEQNSEEHYIRFENGIPKIYRETFSEQKNSLAVLHGSEEIPFFFQNACLMDVTEIYPFIKAKDVSVAISNNQLDKKYAYLCVFDALGWTPVAWSKIENEQALFKNVGPNVVYHAALYDDGIIKPIGSPFFLDTLGCVASYEPEGLKIEVRYTLRNDDKDSYKGHEYELFYMHEGAWLSAGKEVVKNDDLIVFEQVPSNALYWLRNQTNGVDERIFEVKDKTIIWH